MPFISLSLILDENQADAFSDQLIELGAISVNVEDAEEGTVNERPIFGEPGGSTGMWSKSRLTALFQCGVDAVQIGREAASMLGHKGLEGLGGLTFGVETVEDIDWVQQTRDQFQPIQISDRVWIVPTWHAAPDRAAINIALDPGAAFGTGSHPTTRLCLQWLEQNVAVTKNSTMLDYGCGSGILAIAAKKFGTATTVGVDIDAQAIDAARYNATQNQVEITFSTTDVTLDFVADITVTNILANPLKVLAPLLASHTQPGGQLALAGILDHQADDIVAIYQPWFDLKVWRSAEGWSCIAGVRR